MRRFISAHAYRLRLSDGPLECKPQAKLRAFTRKSQRLRHGAEQSTEQSTAYRPRVTEA